MPAAHKPLVLVTGCSGLIGARLMNDLSRDHQVVGLDVKQPEALPAGAAWLKCDMTDDDSVQAALAETAGRYGDRIASVLHLAAYYDFAGEPSPLYEKLTIEGTRRLLQQLQRYEVEQFVFSSTLLVMKPAAEGERLTEEGALQGEWEYPQSKIAAEKEIREHSGKIPAVSLRIAGVYDEDGNSPPITQQISRIYEKQMESYLFPGNKDYGQSFVHADDLTRCFRKVVEHRHELGPQEVFLIGEEDTMSYEELQDRIGQLIHGTDWTTIRIPKVVAKTGAWAKEKMASEEEDKPFIRPWMVDLADQNYPVSIDRARSRLGWTPDHTLRDTLPEMIRRLQANPVQWYKKNGIPLPDDLEVAQPR